MRFVVYAVVGAVVGIIVVGFVLGLVRGMTVDDPANAFEPTAMAALNKTATIIGILLGAPAGVGFAAWKPR